MISEKIELLGKGCYKDIPNELTITSMPTASELDYVGSEDFDATMLDKILPQCIAETGINFRNLLEVDYHWLCRGLRLLNYGPYYTTNAIFCDKCHHTSRGEFSVNLNTIPCKPLPEGFNNDVVVSKDEFIDFDKDVHLHLLTIQDVLNSEKDKAFQSPASGMVNRELSRICYAVTSIGNEKGLTPVQVKLIIQDKMSSADYIILKNVVSALTDYGLRAGGSTQCPKCGNPDAAFIALMDDRFLRPTLGDLRKWKLDRARRTDENVSGSETKAVRKHN